MILAELLKDWPCEVHGGSIRVTVTGITDDASAVQKGNIYVARKGKVHDGWGYVDEALSRGAVAVVHNHPNPTYRQDIPMVWVPNCLTFLSFACKKVYGSYDELLTIIAVTGTNGKTTVTHFIGQLLEKLRVKVAVLGTLGLFINGEKQELKLPPMTTPPPTYLYRIFSYCVDKGVTHIVLEASSLGLSEHRLDDCAIDYGVYLNLSRDHYDEHGGKQYYEAAKKQLSYFAKHLIVNADDIFCHQLKAIHPNVTTFGKSKVANISIVHTEEGAEQTEMLVQHHDIPIDVKLPFVGEYHQQNMLAAIAVLLKLDYPLTFFTSYIAELKLPEGRLQEVPNELDIRIIIDYAHTPSALRAVLKSLKLVAKQQLIVIFGCGGNRDQGKRKEMGEVANRYAQKIWLTTDNPRNEIAENIVEDILEGIRTTSYIVEHDRQKAIYQALSAAQPGDIVVIAGKGHEEGQTIANKIIPFSDYKIAEGIVEDLRKKRQQED